MTRGGPIVLEYRLAELPTAQHRSGLAGLVLLARSRKRPGLELLEVAADRAAFGLDLAGLEQLFAEIHGTEPGGGRPWRPRADFMAGQEPGGPDPDGLWTRLWRDWLWAVPCASAKAREPFESRAEGRPALDAAQAWSDLGSDGAATELDGGTLLGSFALNFDQVPVREPVRWRFLLNFWPWASMVFLLRRSRAWGGRNDQDGFLAAVADIGDLAGFCAAFPAMLRQRGRERVGPRPREALLDHPAEAALEFARRLEGPGAGGPALAYEAYHAKVHGKGMRVQAVFRLRPDRDQLAEYRAFRALGYCDPTFRRGGIQNLLDRGPWFGNFQEVFGPAGCLRRTILCEPFRRDARMAFRVAARNSACGRPLEALVRDRVSEWVLGRVRARCGEEPGSPGFQEQRRQVALAEFQVLRERPAAAVAAWFGTTILAFTSLETAEARRLGQALGEDPGRVQIMALLALAAVA
jgi:CRISPR-associated protein Cmx8